MATEARSRLVLPLVPVLFGAAVIAEVGYPLTHGQARNALTIAIVLLAGVASIASAHATHGTATTAVLFATTVVDGFTVEVLGVHTGVPFGRYTYDGSLGPRLFAVPVVVAFAWPMMAWPAALAARRLVSSYPARVIVGGYALAAWDVFLDPQLTAAGHWRWTYPSPHLPGVGAVPLTNYAGWLVVAIVMSAALQSRLPACLPDPWPRGFYVWTWVASTLALAAFLGLPAAAGWGCLAMGAVAAPLLVAMVSGRR